MPYSIRRLPEIGLPELSDPCWDALEIAPITRYPWAAEGDFRPRAEARLGWNALGLHGLLRAWEGENLRAEVTETGGMVCRDSCLECFLQPFPDSDARYLNIELNPRGVVHLGLGEGRGKRFVYRELPEGFHVRAGMPGRAEQSPAPTTGFVVRAGMPGRAEQSPAPTTVFVVRAGTPGRAEQSPAPTTGFSVNAGRLAEAWAVSFTLPDALLEAIYGRRLSAGSALRGNFFKCGDATPRPHWGVWHPVGTPKPDYHRPEYFAEMVLE